MSKSKVKVKCKYCGKMFTKSGIQNHEKHCSENPANKLATENIEEVEEVEEVEEKVEEEKDLKAQVKIITNPQKFVKIKLNRDLYTYIGDKYYDFKVGKTYKVPQNVKRILGKAGMLKPM